MKYLSMLSAVILLAGCQTATQAPVDNGITNTERVVSSGLNTVYSGDSYSGGKYVPNSGLASTYSAGGRTVVIREKNADFNSDGTFSAGNNGSSSSNISTNKNRASVGDYYNEPSYGKNVVGGPGAAGKDRVIYFGYDSASIDNRAKSIVQQHSAYLVKHPETRILLEGHTDSRGSREYNIALGERRAISVLKLFKNSGVPKSQIRVISYGEERPAVQGFSESAYQRNRRAVIQY